MSYSLFLQVMSHLSGEKRGRFNIEGQTFFIERQQKYPKKEIWVLSTKVFNGEGYLPPTIRDCISSSGVLRWQTRGASLKLEPLSKSVFLMHEIEPAKHFIPFRSLMRDFIDLAQEWRTHFDDLSSKDLNYI